MYDCKGESRSLENRVVGKGLKCCERHCKSLEASENKSSSFQSCFFHIFPSGGVQERCSLPKGKKVGPSSSWLMILSSIQTLQNAEAPCSPSTSTLSSEGSLLLV
jgi:hypothetical protein